MNRTTAAASLFLALSSIAASAAHADVIYYFSKAGLYNGTTIQDANTFASATFKTGASNTVTLKMSVLSGLDAGAYVNDWAFNVDSAIRNLQVSSSGAPAATSIENGRNEVNNFGGARGGDFDLAFHFSNANPGQLAVGATSTYTLSATGLTESSFSLVNEKGIYSAVKVQGYGNGLSSEYKSGNPTGNPVPPTSIPEPTTVALLGLGLLGFAATRRNSKKG